MMSKEIQKKMKEQEVSCLNLIIEMMVLVLSELIELEEDRQQRCQICRKLIKKIMNSMKA